MSRPDLQTALESDVLGFVERLRQLLLSVAHDDAAAQSQANIQNRVRYSDLQALVRLPTDAAPELGANTGDLDIILQNLAPRVVDLERSALNLGVTTSEFTVLKGYLQHPLPNRRVIGYCALLCLCALRQER